MDCYLKYNSLVNMNLRKFQFAGNMIQESFFEGCNLMGSNFRDCRLEATQITECDIRDADFDSAVGYQINIHTNKMKGAKFTFPEVVNLLHELEIKIKELMIRWGRVVGRIEEMEHCVKVERRKDTW